jgi:hypothetical protein
VGEVVAQLSAVRARHATTRSGPIHRVGLDCKGVKLQPPFRPPGPATASFQLMEHPAAWQWGTGGGGVAPTNYTEQRPLLPTTDRNWPRSYSTEGTYLLTTPVLLSPAGPPISLEGESTGGRDSGGKRAQTSGRAGSAHPGDVNLDGGTVLIGLSPSDKTIGNRPPRRNA